MFVCLAIVRLSESVAKMSLSDIATERHVEEAIRLFNISTYEAVTSGVLQSERIFSLSSLLLLFSCYFITLNQNRCVTSSIPRCAEC